MSNSPLCVCTIPSPNNSGKRTHSIDRITIHCVVGQCSAVALGNLFAVRGNWSSNYGVGRGGDIGCYVDEDTVSQCSSSYDNDNRGVTIECASDNFHPYAVTPGAWNGLIDLCADICYRNGKRRLLWLGSKGAALAYQPADDEMVMTAHRWFANKACPGDYLYNRFGVIAEEVNERLEELFMTRYGKIADVPDWGVETVKKLCERGIIQGRGAERDEAGYPTDLDLSDDMLRLLVIEDRAGLYDWQATNGNALSVACGDSSPRGGAKENFEDDGYEPSAAPRNYFDPWTETYGGNAE